MNHNATKLIIIGIILALIGVVGWSCAKNIVDYGDTTQSRYAEAMSVLNEK